MSRQIFPLRLDAGPLLSRHSAQLFERSLLLWEWSSPGKGFCFVSACETEMRLFSPVVPFRCCDGAHRFLKQQAGTIVHSKSGNAWSYRRLWAYGFLRLSEGA